MGKSRMHYNGSQYPKPADPPKPALPPAGVHIAKAERIGDSLRDRYLERLREAYAGGYLGLPEQEARMTAVMKAEVKADLELLVKDLPKEEPKSPPPPVVVEKRPGVVVRGSSVVSVIGTMFAAYYSYMFYIADRGFPLAVAIVTTAVLAWLLSYSLRK